MDLTTCPTCGLPAEVRDRFVLESTAGPMEHAATLCAQRHTYRLPVVLLEPSPAPQSNPSRSTSTRR